uniref:Ig-like domain-containing protein n=1 Tax=Ursus maritimus TaxID=29073 RepID=A0A452URQ5_URSMA
MCFADVLFFFFFFLGVPEAEVTWFRNKTKLGSPPHGHEGSLLLTDVSPSDQGLYSCRAANVHGELTENTQLLILDPPQVPTQLEDIRALLSASGLNLPSVLTSPLGAQLVLDPGNSALLGCPVKGHPTPNITWFHGGQPVATVTGLTHHILAAGQILQVANLSGGSQGEFSCLAQNEAGTLVQKASLVIQVQRALHRASPSRAAQTSVLPDTGWHHLTVRAVQRPSEAREHPELLVGGLQRSLEGQPVESLHRDVRQLWLPGPARGVCARPHQQGRARAPVLLGAPARQLAALQRHALRKQYVPTPRSLLPGPQGAGLPSAPSPEPVPRPPDQVSQGR